MSLGGARGPRGSSLWPRGGVDDAAPGGLVAPDVLAKSLELQNLAVVDEEVDLVAVVLDVPFEDRAVGSLEHHVLESEAVDDRRRGGRVPFRHVFGDALRLDHDDRRAGLERPAPAVDEVADVLP